MAKLTSAQEEQIVSMRKDGRTPEEVVSFFKATYKINLPLWKVHYCIGKSKKCGGKSAGRRKAIGEGTKQGSDDKGADDNIISLVEQLRAELEAYSKFVIGKIRIELVKAIAEARKKRIDVGEDVKEFEAPEVEEI
jgi:hypothetical protein